MNIIFELLATFTDACFMAWFVPGLVGASIKDKKWTTVFPIVGFLAQLIFDIYMPGFALIPAALGFILATCLALSLMKSKPFWCVFAGSAYIMVIMLLSSFYYAVLSLYLPDADAIMQGSNMSVRIIHIITAKVGLFAVYLLILRLFSKDKSMGIANGVLAFCLSLATAIGLGALMKVATLVDGIEILVIAAVLVIVNISFYLLITQNQKLEKHKYELKILKERESYEQKRSREATIIWDNIKKVRHDLNNHFFALQTLLDLGDTEKCKSYLAEVQSTVSTMGNLIKSGNSVLDYLINTKLGGLKDTQVLITGNVADFSDIKDSDMTKMLGNILDNAVEALEKVKDQKRIELYFTSHQSNRIIVCKNSISRSALKQNKKLLTSKANSEYHGFGHIIIEETAARYGGVADYFEAEGMFGVQLTIPTVC